MSTVDARLKLLARQAKLVRSLTGQGPRPVGFDLTRLDVATTALADKRARAVARAWPGLVRSLGGRFDRLFAAFAASTPVPTVGGPLADGRAFARMLQNRGELTDAGRLEALAVDLHYDSHAGGLVPRRGPTLRLVWCKQPRRLVLGARIPGFGEWCLSV